MDPRTPLEQETGLIYDTLFTSYSKQQFESSLDLFLQRHTKWQSELGFTPAWFKGKKCLDGGCGGGRFVVALSQLGAQVEGIDVSAAAVQAATERIKERSLEVNAHVQVASVLSIPFPDQTFDYVISSGVIHHTPNPKKAFNELTRVLKPGGKIFLSVYGNGGLKWFVNDLFRYTICKIIPFSLMNRLWAMVGIPANKRYNGLDNLYVDHCDRYSAEEIYSWLEGAGFWNFHRVKFERYDFSTVRSRLIHGEGWIQVYADKRFSQ